jgi:SAM-dependent methyltransferase
MDAVVCNFGIGHFPNPDRAVTEIARILSPGGMVALSWWDQPDHHRVNGVFFEAVARAGAAIPPGLPPGPPVFRFSDDSELSAILQNVGLLDVSVEAHSTLHVLAGADELWEGILSATVRTAAVVNLQTEAVRRLIRFHFDELVRQYIVGKPQRLHIPVAFKIVRGKKP